MADWIMVILTALAIFVSVIAMLVSSLASSKGNEVAIAANEMLKGQVEMQIREMITAARERFENLAIQSNSDNENELLKKSIISALENIRNTYDEACARYLDNRTDRERFKKMYFDEIRNIVESNETKEFYIWPQTKYRATYTVYEEWFNLEKKVPNKKKR